MQVKGTVNYVELIGWLGNDPNHRYLPSGAGVCEFDVATRRVSAKGNNGEWTTETEWTTVEVWDQLAAVCHDTLRKGSRVRVVGSLRTRSWEDREMGIRRYKTVVRAEDVLFLDSRHDDGEAES
ncbi:MAG: single-stranded DNA-binding protein [Herpetosiphonaceae bacterium]|nr:MAG: single-stranded DNA-binding protein [Herpetosiphonaceae bacterium]